MDAHVAPYRQRATILAQLPPLVAEFGVNMADVLNGTGIAPEELVPGAFVSYAGVLAMLDRAAELTGREDLGVLLARRLSLAALGPAGDVMRHAGTLGDALSDYGRFQIWNSTGAAAYIYRVPEEYVFGYAIYDPAGANAVYIHDLVLAAGCTLVFILTQNRVQPVEMWSMRPPPDDPAPLANYAGCTVRYGQAQTCIFLAPSAADIPLPDADPAAHTAELAQLAERTASGSWGAAAMVRHALCAGIASGHMGMPDVAAQIHQHPRTLRRALEREGTTFTALRDEVRYTVARELLSLTPLPVGDIALALNFADNSAFTHAFHLWSGTSPSEWRRTKSPETREPVGS